MKDSETQTDYVVDNKEASSFKIEEESKRDPNLLLNPEDRDENQHNTSSRSSNRMPMSSDESRISDTKFQRMQPKERN